MTTDNATNHRDRPPMRPDAAQAPRRANRRVQPTETVVYAADTTYAPHAFASLYSLLANNRDTPIDVKILAVEPDQRFFANAQFLRDVHPGVTISWLPAHAPLIKDAPASLGDLDVATCYRLLLGKLLPASAERVLYMDADTIVRGSLRELFDLDLEGHVLAATPSYDSRDSDSVDGAASTATDRPDRSPRFDAGVLRIDMRAWRDNEVDNRCLEYITRSVSKSARSELRDQDALNEVLAGKWLDIGPKFNHCESTCDDRRWEDFSPWTQCGFIVPERGPVIAHYADRLKPWEGGCPHPYSADYWRYRMKTPFATRLGWMRARLISAAHVIPWHTAMGTITDLSRNVSVGNPVERLARALTKST